MRLFLSSIAIFNTVQSLTIVKFHSGLLSILVSNINCQIFVVSQRLLSQTALQEVSLEMGKYQQGKSVKFRL